MHTAELTYVPAGHVAPHVSAVLSSANPAAHVRHTLAETHVLQLLAHARQVAVAESGYVPLEQSVTHERPWSR